MNLLIVLGALIFLMFVAYRGYKCHPVRPNRCPWRGVADRSLARSTTILQRLHGEDGRLREELLPRFHAGRRLR